MLAIAAWEPLKRETDHESHQSIITNRKAVRRPAWNKNKLTGPKPFLRPDHARPLSAFACLAHAEPATSQ
jgi:hypothetical protein